MKVIKKGRILVWAAIFVLLSAPVIGEVKRYIPPAPEEIEVELLEMVNRERELVGRKHLQPHPFLQEIARSHSAKMAAEGKLSHDFPGWPGPEQKMRQGNLCFLASAENVAQGRTQAPFARFIHKALMSSSGHRANILDERMLQAGIGVIRSGDDYYVTEEFAAIIACPLPEEARAFIENELNRWYREKFSIAPGILLEARSLAAESAQHYLLDDPIDLPALNDMEMQEFNIRYNDMATILAELKKKINGNRVTALTVGVAWGRTEGFPGGTYSVCLLLFK
jgi:hypothetical protein